MYRFVTFFSRDSLAEFAMLHNKTYKFSCLAINHSMANKERFRDLQAYRFTYVFRWIPCGWRRWLCRQRDSISALWLRPLRRPQSRCEGRSVSSTCDLDGEQSTLINRRRRKKQLHHMIY